MRLARLLLTLAFLLPASAAWAQSGKIAGVVTDAATGEPLPGVNVAIAGTTQGSVTDLEGYYVILNVRPGTYDVRASFIGYTPAVRENVRVNIDLTTEVDFALREQAVGLDEVVVSAERPVVQRDISASVANISAEEVENLPVASVSEIVGLQAGFEPGLTVRGVGRDQVQFVVDGMSYTDGRNNVPFTGISYTAIDEIQVQTGGFNAEYGNVRSGLINVVTKDGPRDRYIADVLVRYSAPSQKYFGESPGDINSFWMRPYFDTTPVEGCPEGVALCGTSAWPSPLQEQYPTFGGWKEKADTWNEGKPASEHVTPEQMMTAFSHFTRKDFEVKDPEYDIDGTIGGPVPGIGRMLGDLRFLASYRQTQDSYIVPQQRTSYRDRTVSGKLTSDIGTGMRLSVNGMWAHQAGLNASDQGHPNMYTGAMPEYPWDFRSEIMASDIGRDQLFNDWWWSPMDVYRSIFGGQFTHTLSPRTFYEVQLQRSGQDFNTVAGDRRDRSTIRCATPDLQIVDAQNGQCAANAIPLDAAPFGYEPDGADDGLGGGLRTGGHGGPSRDSSEVVRWQARFDITSQLNRYMQLKSGVEYIINDFDIRHGEYDPFFVHHANPKFRWQRSPNQGALYGQAKLEFQGMVANLGLRADYFHAGGEWVEYTPFTRAFASTIGIRGFEDVLETRSTERQLTLSPRLGVSFPITDNSKLYFNYGHFRQNLNPRDLFEVRNINTGAIDRIGNPFHPMPRTVAYELGFEQNLADLFLLRVAGFYRDLAKQSRTVRYLSLDDEVNYERFEPLNYGDVRGFEVTLTKNRGQWLRGFVNYTYIARKFGNFGFGVINENRVEMRQYMATTTDHYQWKPIPEPFARANVEILLPRDFGPDVAGVNLLGDWRINFLGTWREGTPLTWNGQTLQAGPGNDPKIAFNTSWKDYYNVDLRLSKNFGTAVGRAQFFVDFSNVFNIRHMSRYGNQFAGSQDDLKYYRSLHIDPDLFAELENTPYDFIPGDDTFGDRRKRGVAFDPITIVPNVQEVEGPTPGRLYWDKGAEQYMTFQNGSWGAADPSRVEQVLEDKAYIDMPNQSYFSFMNPRNTYFGLRLSF